MTEKITKRKIKLFEAWREATKSEIEKLDRCVEKVKEKGHVKSPWAICLKSLKMKRGKGGKWLKQEQKLIEEKDTFTIEDVIKTIGRNSIDVNSTAILFYPEYDEIPVFRSENILFYDLPYLKEEYPRTLTGIKDFITDIFYSICELTLKKLEKSNFNTDTIDYIEVDFDLTESVLKPLIHRGIIREIPVEYKEEEHKIPVKFEQLLKKVKEENKK